MVVAPTPQTLNVNLAIGLVSFFAFGTLAYLGYTKVQGGIVAITQQYKLVYYVLPSYLDVTKDAIFEAGGGTYEGGMYKNVAYEVSGSGQFLPVAEAGAVPHTGTVGKLEKTEEIRVEVMCVGRKVTRAAVEALKRTHPYQVPAYEVYKMETF